MGLISEFCPKRIIVTIKSEFDEYSLNLDEIKLILNKIELGEDYVDKAKRYRRLYLGTELEHRVKLKREEEDMKKKLSENQVITFKKSSKKDKVYKIGDIKIK